MALMELNFYSQTLGMHTQVNLILPQQCPSLGMTPIRKEGKYPVLYLLHPEGGDFSSWCRKTSVERYAEKRGIAVVMPSGDLSMYTDMAHGGNYMEYISYELPLMIQGMLPLSEKREDNYIAGASMGGYGALKTALKKPEQYAAAACFSGGNIWKNYCEPEWRKLPGRENRRILEAVFGTAEPDRISGSEHDLMWLAEQNKKEKKELPFIYLSCGTSDEGLELSRELGQYFEKTEGTAFEYREADGGHTWEFWDSQIEYVMNRLK